MGVGSGDKSDGSEGSEGKENDKNMAIPNIPHLDKLDKTVDVEGIADLDIYTASISPMCVFDI